MAPQVQFKAESSRDIRLRVAAYRLLFGVEPVVRVSGTIRATDGETAWLTRGFGEKATSIGAIVQLDLGTEGTMRFRVAENANEARYSLSER